LYKQNKLLEKPLDKGRSKPRYKKKSKPDYKKVKIQFYPPEALVIAFSRGRGDPPGHMWGYQGLCEN